MNRIVAIAASAGGLGPVRQIIEAIPPACNASVFVVIHTGPYPSLLPTLLATSPNLPITFAEDGAFIEPRHVYVPPPDRHMLVESNRIRLNAGPKVHHTRPAADPLFISAAEAYGQRVVGIVLSGGDGDGTEGLRAITAHGGIGYVQKPEEAEQPAMPLSAIAGDHPDACLPVREIARRVAELCQE